MPVKYLSDIDIGVKNTYLWLIDSETLCPPAIHSGFLMIYQSMQTPHSVNENVECYSDSYKKREVKEYANDQFQRSIKTAFYIHIRKIS